jgi:hydrogenase maturation protease
MTLSAGPRPRVLVAGVGNVFLGDDGFGVEVARAAGRRDPARLGPVGDFGIRGVHLAYELLEGYEAAILVDAAPRGEAPGTVYVIEPDLDGEPARRSRDGSGVLVDAHGMEPDAVFALLKALGGTSRSCWWSAASRPRSRSGWGSARRWRARSTRPWPLSAS